MTREQARNTWALIKAYGEGKIIQEKHVGSSTDVWTDMHEMEELDLNDSYWEYRIKPEGNPTIEQNGELTDRVRELEQQIEKMKNCFNCAKGDWNNRVECIKSGCVNKNKWEIKEK